MRAANDKAELDALENRVNTAEEYAKAQNCTNQLNAFEADVKTSGAVICRPLGEIKALTASNNVLYTTFYNQVDGQQRIPEDNEFDAIRESADSLVFPHYHKNILFAALSLDGVGVTNYGGHSLLLKEEMISHRASVFDSNTLLFIKKNKISIGDPIPLGFRAPWQKREKLAKAKLYPKITKQTKPSEHANILIDQITKVADPDFIEVHIFGVFNRGAIDKITFSSSNANRADKVIIESIKKKLDAANIQYEDK
ncbi:hypothetical protein GCM10011332_31220 [Terasakiella brassicae]|uniref:Uncharacterized protein n=1 Tax=Terasakiella brassicae TaxID=1634917 RepID=A0A917FGX6_9PROT|nr:hypothetical protein GCM10011332_31220 [Terasakiella brassicae]